MKLTVLGCCGPYGRAGGGAASSYLVENGGDFIVLDMGPGTMTRLMSAVDVRRVRYVFLSHLHFDHTSDFLPFRYLLEDLGHKITLFIRKEESAWYDILTNHPLINVVNVDENSSVSAGSLNLRFFEMKHTVPCLAVRIEGDKTLVYTGDTVFNDNIIKAAENADCLLADCSKPESFKGPHMTVKDAVKLREKLKIPVIATHQSPDYSPEEYFKNFPGITAAKENTTYSI